MRDTQCGCKGFQLAEGRLLTLLSFIDGLAFDAKILYWRKCSSDERSPAARHVGRLSKAHRCGPGRGRPGHVLDIRSIRSRRYEIPVVELTTRITAEACRVRGEEARLHGLVLARAEAKTLVVLGRNDASGGPGLRLDSRVR